ncbi:hypothetical protein Tco_0878867 [Tanacetum coccineum]|uniref:Uncharacterized protein n=1 Tax=Tanacetum coccineum TaxID=301880 RepID=A0ABQ5C2H8_9ASTR
MRDDAEGPLVNLFGDSWGGSGISLRKCGRLEVGLIGGFPWMVNVIICAADRRLSIIKHGDTQSVASIGAMGGGYLGVGVV